MANETRTPWVLYLLLTLNSVASVYLFWNQESGGSKIRSTLAEHEGRFLQMRSGLDLVEDRVAKVPDLQDRLENIENRTRLPERKEVLATWVSKTLNKSAPDSNVAGWRLSLRDDEYILFERRYTVNSSAESTASASGGDAIIGSPPIVAGGTGPVTGTTGPLNGSAGMRSFTEVELSRGKWSFDPESSLVVLNAGDENSLEGLVLRYNTGTKQLRFLINGVEFGKDLASQD